MEFKTKYDIGQVVWHIKQNYTKEYAICEFCAGSGTVAGVNQMRASCPKCHGRKGDYINTSWGWKVIGKVTVGHIQVSHRGGSDGFDPDSIFDNYGMQTEKYEEKYMCLETGIGSGTVHDVGMLWPDIVEAQVECDRLNAEDKAA